jgi:TrmH family RNA methyltransferase
LITSPHNDKLKEVRRLATRRGREKSGCFVAEGEDLLEAAADWTPVARLVAAGSGLPGEEVDPKLLAEVSQLGSGTRAIGIYEQRWLQNVPESSLCVGLWDVRDPGNVGTVLRSALAFGASCVALGPNCADPYSPKAVRASMGAIFSVPVVRFGMLEHLPRPITALAGGRGEPLEAPEGTVLVGGERHGLPDEVLEGADRVAHIPMVAGESLNAAMAATIALYEAARRMARP